MRAALRLLKGLSIYAGIIVVTIALIDVVLFFTLPEQIGSRLPGYREGFYLIEILGRGYPKDYFEANAERGFDIKPTDVPRTDQVHHMEEYSYHVWSNAIGCFDKPVGTLKDKFWYLAGDSIAWGHAKFENLIGSMLEKYDGIDVLQCGVTHIPDSATNSQSFLRSVRNSAGGRTKSSYSIRRPTLSTTMPIRIRR